MNETSPSSTENDLTGVWQGLYSYAGGESVAFVATIIDSASSISGGTHESAVSHSGARATLFATLSGARRGSSVSFLKTYDGTGGWSHAVRYDGALSGDATEIEGRWRIGWLSGRFTMTRPRRAARRIARKIEERV
jgi:hypothetical protein